jgi:hypothetical protein
MRWMIAVTILVLLLGGQAEAKSKIPEEQRNFIKHFAAVTVAGNNCDYLQVDNTYTLAGMLRFGMNIQQLEERGAHRSLWRKKLKENNRALKKDGPEGFCAAANLLYGANGLNVPGWVTKSAEEQIPESHKRIIEYFANATIASGTCKKLQVNDFVVVMGMSSAGVKAEWLQNRGRYEFFWEQQLAENRASALEYGEAYCSSAQMRYGKNGLLLKGLLVKN